MIIRHLSISQLWQLCFNVFERSKKAVETLGGEAMELAPAAASKTFNLKAAISHGYASTIAAQVGAGASMHVKMQSMAAAAREASTRRSCKKINGKVENVNGVAVALPKERGSPSLLQPDMKERLTRVVKLVAAALGYAQCPTKLHLVDEERSEHSHDMRRGKLLHDDTVYRQRFVIRSYEVGFDRTASIETIVNLFQETALNHVGMSDFVGDGMGATHAMMRNRLIWVVTRMHVQVKQYPVWGDIVEIDSWVGASGKNGMQRDFFVRDFLTGEILAQATSNWAMMNQDTRKLSRMPDEVRAEISPYFVENSSLMKDLEHSTLRIPKINNITAPCIKEALVPKLNDMDMNQHVNHVKYIGWVLESVPEAFLAAHELKSMTLEYRKECSPSDVVTSLAQPHVPLHYIHLLQMQDGTEVLRGRTEWRSKSLTFPN